MHFVRNILILLAASTLLLACEDKNGPKPPPPGEGRTVLVYMAANTNLNSNAFTDINEMESAWDDGLNGHLYVLYNTSGNRNTLYKIQQDDDRNKINSEIAKEYPTTKDPCDVEFLKEVATYVRKIQPGSSYGLFLWAHGTGWLPQGSSSPLRFGQNPLSKLGVDEITNPENPESQTPTQADDKFVTSYTFGSVYSSRYQMEMYDMATALAGMKFDYIYFDACHMASIESVYQLRNVTDYVISTAAETLASGAPYDVVTPMMFESNPEQTSIALAEAFYTYYNDPKRNAFSRSGTISVVKTAALPALADAVKNAVTPQIKAIPTANIQQFGRNLGTGANYTNIFFDLEDFITQTWGENPTFKAKLTAAIPYQASTSSLFSEITVRTHCGVTAYVPNSSQTKTLGIYRTKYDWAVDSGLGSVVK